MTILVFKTEIMVQLKAGDCDMDFDKGFNGLDDNLKNNGKVWYKNLADLRDEALKPDSLSVSGESPIDHRYQSAVNWYNIKRESHLTDKQCSRFVFFIASGWGKKGSYGENEILGWKHLRALGIESEFQEELIGRGAEISPDALKEEIGDYLITFIPERDLAVTKNPIGNSFDRMDLDPINILDSRKIIRGFLDNPSPLVWCSSLKDIENSIQKANTFDEIA